MDKEFILIINHEGKILYCNDLYQQTLSIRFPRLCLKNILERIHSMDKENFIYAIQNVSQEHRETEIKYRFSIGYQFVTFKSTIMPIQVSVDKSYRFKLTSRLLNHSYNFVNLNNEGDNEFQDFLAWCRERQIEKLASNSITQLK